MVIRKPIFSVPGGYQQITPADQIAIDAGAMTVTETGGTQKSLPDAIASKVGLSTPIVLDSTTLTAQLRSRFQDPLDLYGYLDASFDGVSTPIDNHDALATILTTAGRKCFLPTGRIYVGSTLPTITNKSVVLHGLGRGETLVFADGVSGLNISQANYTNRTDIRGISFETLGKETGGFAITVAYSDADAVINTNMRRGKFVDLTFAGFSLEQQGWVGGIDAYNTNGFEFENISGYGRLGTTAEINAAKAASAAAGGTALDQSKAGLAAAKFNMKRLIRLRTGNTYGIGLVSMRNINSLNMEVALEVAGGRSIEGIQIHGFNFVANRVSVLCTQSADSPGLLISGGHMNFAERGVVASHMPEFIMKDVDCYKLPESVTESVCVELANQANFFDISFMAKNQSTDSTLPFVGLRVSDSSYGRADILIERSSTGVDLTGNSTGNDLLIRQRGGLTSAAKLWTSTAAGTNNIRRSPFSAQVANTTVQTTTASGVFPVSLGMNVFQGESYEGILTISHTSTSATDFLATLTNLGGGGVVNFQRGVSGLGIREQQAANVNGAFALPFTMDVTTSGAISLAVLAQSTGGNGQIAVGNCRLTIKELN